MSHDLTSVKIAALVATGFEHDHVLDAQELLHRAGATMTMVSAGADRLPKAGKASTPLANIPIASANETGFDALFLPGGQTNADNLAQDAAAMKFVRSFLTASKPIGAIGHGVKLLVAADGVAGRRIAADPALREQIQKAAGVWIDKPVATDRYLVTAADIQSMEPFLDAFARSCAQQKVSSGASLHTD